MRSRFVYITESLPNFFHCLQPMCPPFSFHSYILHQVAFKSILLSLNYTSWIKTIIPIKIKYPNKLETK